MNFSFLNILHLETLVIVLQKNQMLLTNLWVNECFMKYRLSTGGLLSMNTVYTRLPSEGMCLERKWKPSIYMKKNAVIMIPTQSYLWTQFRLCSLIFKLFCLVNPISTLIMLGTFKWWMLWPGEGTEGEEVFPSQTRIIWIRVLSSKMVLSFATFEVIYVQDFTPILYKISTVFLFLQKF